MSSAGICYALAPTEHMLVQVSWVSVFLSKSARFGGGGYKNEGSISYRSSRDMCQGFRFLIVTGKSRIHSTYPTMLGQGSSCVLEPLICHQSPHGPRLQGAEAVPRALCIDRSRGCQIPNVLKPAWCRGLRPSFLRHMLTDTINGEEFHYSLEVLYGGSGHDIASTPSIRRVVVGPVHEGWNEVLNLGVPVEQGLVDDISHQEVLGWVPVTQELQHIRDMDKDNIISL